MLYNFKKWGPQYTLIGGSKTGLEAPADHRSYFRPHSKLLTILVGALVIIASFFAGKWSSTGHNPLSELNLGTKSFEFMYNRTFGEVPSNKSTKAWADLFPTQGGYFIHPTIAPKRSVFSVFHQLHCLNGMREGYWTVYQAAMEGKKLSEDDLPMMSSPSHIRHCIDLIRNALICQPDLTIEERDDTLRGVKGFGTVHQCKDWEQLIAWTSKWETYRPAGRVNMKPSHDTNHMTGSHDHHH